MPDPAHPSTAPAEQTATLTLPGREPMSLPVVVGSEGEYSIDVTKLRSSTGYITLDPGYRNTGSVTSDITFINGEEGILRYRGYPIEQVCQHLSFIETALLLIYGERPTPDMTQTFSVMLTENQMLHEGLRQVFDGFPTSGSPMAILSAMINALYTYQPEVADVEYEDQQAFMNAAARLMAKVGTAAAASYKTSIGHPIMYPDPKLDYASNFLHMMFSIPKSPYAVDPDIRQALNLIFILHADHEQNCSTSTVRMVGSSGANLFASCAAGVCALWGPLHGGANVAVLKQLEEIHEANGVDAATYLELVKQKKRLLYGFGHGVYKNFDPRAKILKSSADKVLSKLGVNDPLLQIAKELEEQALTDDYFVSRKLYPNVDFYSGIIMRAMGIPTDMFTVMFAIGRMPGWIANWKEVRDQKSRIYRPRQVYTGYSQRHF